MHNSYGVFEAQKAGFKRIVLSRELSFQEIKSIVKNTDLFKRFNYFELPAYIEKFGLQEFQKTVKSSFFSCSVK
ncbi:MAG: U32 family peptidase [Endomicrobium sp.]|nr:U32 family peptidase [Endomicrobium sp.]